MQYARMLLERPVRIWLARTRGRQKIGGPFVALRAHQRDRQNVLDGKARRIDVFRAPSHLSQIQPATSNFARLIGTR